MRKLLVFLAFLFFSINVTIGQNDVRPYSNPILIYGTSFGNYFKTLYKLGDFDTMMKFTSKQSIKKYGYENILSFYKSTDFGYDMKLMSRRFVNGIYTLNYNAAIMGTKKVIRMDVAVENDSCKLILDNLFFHLGISMDSVMNTMPTVKF